MTVAAIKLVRIARGALIVDMAPLMRERDIERKKELVRAIGLPAEVESEILSLLPQDGDSKKEAGAKRREFTSLLQKHCVMLNAREAEEIKEKKLYLAMPTGGADSPRGRLEKFVTGEDPISLRREDIAPDDVMYAVVAMIEGGEKALENLRENLPKLKAIFADDLAAFEDAIKTHKAASPSEKDIVSKFARSVEWRW